MSTWEGLVLLLLTVIAWFLYQIAKQLSYLTGKRIKLSIFNRQIQGGQFTSKLKTKAKTKPKLDEGPIEKLPN
jgi:hypothetical protein